MNAHPDFENVSIPREVEVGPFVLTPLSPGYLDEDFTVVKESESVLTGLFGDPWPKGLTLEDNLIDLRRHDEEFEAKQAFSWIVRSNKREYLGCAYLYPTTDQRGEGHIFTWIRDTPNRLALITQFNQVFSEWLHTYLPKDYSLTCN